MPRYDFKCNRCGFKEEATMSFEKAEKDYPCPECKGIMERQFSPQGTNFLIRWGKPKVRQKVKKMGV